MKTLITAFSGDRRYTNRMYRTMGIAGLCSIFIAEMIVQVYTWRYTWSVVRGLGKVQTQKSLSFFVLRDGKSNDLFGSYTSLKIASRYRRVAVRLTAILP